MARPIGRFHEGGQSHGMGTARREGDRRELRCPQHPRHHRSLHHAQRDDGLRAHDARIPTTTASASPSASPSPSPVQPTPFVSVTPTATSSPVPIGAPSTGGGGTAGVQDVLLFGIGGAALLAGAGSLVYRRRVLRDR